MGFVGDLLGFGDDPGERAAESSIAAAEIQAAGQERAAQIQADYMREALGYLQEREELPQQFREESLQRLAGIAGLPGGVGDQQQLINQAIASPLYGAIMGGQEAGEEAILRSAAATGGLRSGNVQSALYDYNTQLQNKALLESYNQQLSGLQGMAGLPSGAQQIAELQSGIGQTLGGGAAGAATAQAQGLTAAGQAQQAYSQQQAGNLMGLGGLGLLAYGMFSDRRLKRDIKRIGQIAGWNWYTWAWNSVAEKMGLKGECQGCMADEVFAERPDAVILKDLFMWVCYPKIGVFCEGRA